MTRPEWVTEKRTHDLKEAYKLIKPNRILSNRDFRPPDTIEDDFRRLLEHDVPHVNYTYEVIHDWYEAQKAGYSPIFIRAQQTPIDWKSKIGNSDMSSNFKTTYDHTIFKGDYAIREDGILYLLNWNITTHPNNQATQCVECNDILTFTREHAVKTDNYGYVIDEHVELDQDGREVIVNEIPASHSEYSGRPDFSVAQNQPGVTANHLVNMYVQWNEKTKNIRIGDQTKIGAYTYAVHNVYSGEVNLDKTHGCLYLQLRRLAGGVIADDQT